MKVRNQRTGRWIELPDDDGMVWHPKLKRYVSLVDVKAAAERRMAAHDALPVKDRWADAMFGSAWHRNKSVRVAALVRPLCKTDPQSWQEFAAADLGL